MIKKLLLTTFLLFVFLAVQSQVISGKIINSFSSKPIPNVAISTNLKTGTTSNKFGEYTLQIKNVSNITFSCLGFTSITLTIEDLKKKKFVVTLFENVNVLDEIQLNLSKITLDSLLIKSAKSMRENYMSDAVKQDFYASEKQSMSFKKLELDLKSSTLMSKQNRKLAQKELFEFTDKILYQKPRFAKEFVGVISSKKIVSKKNNKLFTISNVNDIVGYRKSDIGEGLTLKGVEKKLQNIVLKHLKEDRTYKVKSGFFKVEDSLSLKEVTRTNDSIKNDNSFGEFWITNYKNDADNKGIFAEKENQKNFFNRKYYEHQLEKNEFLGNNKYYVVSFQPRKSKAKFSGKIYIDPQDFTVKKITYEFADGKRGQHINLKWVLGVKFSENDNSNVLYFEKNKEGKVYTSYFKNTYTNYAYINRPIKFIENTGEKDKVKFNIKVEVLVSESREFLINNLVSIPEETVKPYKKEDYKRKKEFLSKEEYELTDWKNKKLVDDYLKQYQ